jgi:hypothetical protein
MEVVEKIAILLYCIIFQSNLEKGSGIHLLVKKIFFKNSLYRKNYVNRFS